MMTINITEDNSTITVVLEGRLNTTTSPELEAALKPILPKAETLIFDFAGLEYISSSGLRVILRTHQVMSQQGQMIIRNTNEEIMQVFEITGFDSIMNFE